MNLINKKILITGAYGFVGSNIYNKLNKRNRIFLLGNKKNNYHKKNKVNVENLIKTNFAPDIVFHCAGSGTIGEAQDNKIKSYEDDFISTKNLLNYCLLLNTNLTIVYISSAAVYKSNSNLLKPISIYGKNKLKAEKYLKKNLSKKINLIIIRFFSIYGEGLKKQLIWDTCNKMNSDLNLNFFGTGEEKRSWIHISDAINIIFTSIKKKKSRILVLDGHCNNVFKNSEIINKISKYFKPNNKVTFNKKKISHSPKIQFSRCKKLEKWGWKAKMGLEEGIKKYAIWFKKIN